MVLDAVQQENCISFNTLVHFFLFKMIFKRLFKHWCVLFDFVLYSPCQIGKKKEILIKEQGKSKCEAFVIAAEGPRSQTDPPILKTLPFISNRV